MAEPIIIACFPGVGKSTFIENHENETIKDFTNAITPPDIIQQLQNDTESKYIFIPCEYALMVDLDNAGVTFYIVIPDKVRKTEFVNSSLYRQIYDENVPSAVAREHMSEFSSNWDTTLRMVFTAANQIGIEPIVLPVGHYLTDAIKDIDVWEKELT